MEALNKNFKEQLDAIKNAIQKSEQLALYLEEEEDEQYKVLIEAFENNIHVLHEQVAQEKPLQLIAFEQELLDSGFEGLYLPKLLGYSVLRGRISDNYKYIRPQNHFRAVLDAIIQSSNFEQIRQRVGQSIQMGFALSSEIWSANFIAGLENKKVKSFLESQKLNKYRDLGGRRTGLVKYSKQFFSLHYHTADFPEDQNSLNLGHGELRDFLLYRAKNNFDDSTLKPHLDKFISNEELLNNQYFLELLIIAGLYFDVDKDAFNGALSTLRKQGVQFSDQFFMVYKKLWATMNYKIDPEAEKKLAALIAGGFDDDISQYFTMLEIVHGKGYIHEDAINAVREFYYKHEGVSDENSCIRSTILANYNRLLSNLLEADYAEYFEINKVMTAYMEIFSNQQFNQDVKSISLKYVKRLIKVYTDKRGKDYQDIKKFVVSTFVDLGFMAPKELVELFKTRRKKKVVA